MSATLLIEAVLVFALLRIFLKKLSFLSFGGGAKPPRGELADVEFQVCPRFRPIVPEPDPEPDPELWYPGSISGRELTLPTNLDDPRPPSIILIVLYFFRARLPALVAENPPALIPLMILALVFAVVFVLFVVDELFEVELEVIVPTRDKGLGRVILPGGALPAVDLRSEICE